MPQPFQERTLFYTLNKLMDLVGADFPLILKLLLYIKYTP